MRNVAWGPLITRCVSLINNESYKYGLNMNKSIRTNLVFIRRCICTTDTNFKNVTKRARLMGKIMQKDGKHTSKWYNSSPSKPIEFGTAELAPPPAVRRRIAVLNKLFMGHITDIMSTGEVFPELLNRGIEITDIGVTADFSYIRVYWADKALGSEYTFETQQLLNKCAPVIRHKLIELYVMGIVPKIQFVKDKSYSGIKQVDYLLSIADYGPEFKPTLSVKVEQTGEDERLSFAVPKMRNDVFGIDHTRIMSKIKTSLEKAHNATIERGQMSVSVNSFTNVPKLSNVITPIDQTEQELLFVEFLKQKKVNETRKYNKMKKNATNMANLLAADNEEDANNNTFDEFDDYSNNDYDEDEDDIDRHKGNYEDVDKGDYEGH